ncbi:MAG: class I SAM-dependent methyltransferase [Saprospiraceae bacterium]|nr:class I SAM-dependent methyltransferase [Saprospiraceae bacterium]
MEKQHKQQVKEGERFEFGKNWRSFLQTLTDEKISNAEASLKQMLNVDNLIGKTFLDIGCGSGLFSLAAHNLGAEVYSFDFDADSTNCARYLCEKYNKSENWIIKEASVLDDNFMQTLGKFDIVYSWGVLHHTGSQWKAIENAANCCKTNGVLFIALYNDQGFRSKIWLKVKQFYNKSSFHRFVIKTVYYPYFILLNIAFDIVQLRNPLELYRTYKKNRGMSIINDWKDWLGGLPFEVSSPEQVFDFLKVKNFNLVKLKTTTSMGCNEFVFQRINDLGSNI